MTLHFGRRLVASLSFLLVLSFAAGCDTGVSIGLEAEYFHGNWRLDRVRDANGDRTNEVREAIEDLRVTFNADGSFALRVIYVPEDVPDQLVTGTYTVQPTGQLILTVGDFAAPFNATVQSQNEVELQAPAAIVLGVIAVTGIDIELAGTVVLTLARGGPGA